MRIVLALLFSFFAIKSPGRASDSVGFAVTEADKRFLSEALDAVSKNDADWIAEHMAYPLSVTTSKGKRIVKKKAEFTAIVKRELSASVRAKIAADAKKPLFKNWQGVMIGDGILWLSQYRLNDRAPWEYKISAIGFFAFQQSQSVSPRSSEHAKN
jgi:hypothetical protein